MPGAFSWSFIHPIHTRISAAFWWVGHEVPTSTLLREKISRTKISGNQPSIEWLFLHVCFVFFLRAPPLDQKFHRQEGGIILCIPKSIQQRIVGNDLVDLLKRILQKSVYPTQSIGEIPWSVDGWVFGIRPSEFRELFFFFSKKMMDKSVFWKLVLFLDIEWIYKTKKYRICSKKCFPLC